MMKRILGRGLAVTLALAFSLVMLAAAICIPATADWVMHPLMVRFAPPEDTHLPAKEYAPVVHMITGYLQGDDVPFQHIFTLNDVAYAAFNPKEQSHMADVQGLFHLCRMVGWISGGVVITLALLLRRKIDWRTLQRTLIALLGMVALVTLVAIFDFESLFVLFHRIAFTNDLWLLNPQTDLLIRLMPIEFFISYAAIIGGLWLAGMALCIVFTIPLQRLRKKG